MQHKNINIHRQDHTDGTESVDSSLKFKKLCGQNHFVEYKIYDKSIENVFEKGNNKYNNNLLNSKDELEDLGGHGSIFSNSIQRSCSKLLESEQYVFSSDVETTFLEHNQKKQYENYINNNSTYKGEERAKNASKYINATHLTSKEKLYSDKTTYCRPVFNFYNQQFLYKTIQKNTQLKRLVTKLVLERQQEKENVTWNNYINELKNKHGLFPTYSKINTLPPQHQEHHICPEMIDDYYNTKFTSIQSDPCKNLLDDMYKAYSASQPTCVATTKRRDSRNNNHIQPRFQHSSYCYPTCSQGRLIALQREKQYNEYTSRWKKCPSDRNINNDLNVKENSDKTKKCFNDMFHRVFKSSLVQTDMALLKENEFKYKLNCKSTNVKEEICKIAEIVTKHEIDGKSDSNVKQNFLTNIENKLEALIESINKFLRDIKLKNTPILENKFVSCKIDKKNYKKSNETKSEWRCISKTHNVIGNMTLDSSGSTLAVAKIMSQFNQTSPSIKKEDKIIITNTSSSVDNKYIEKYFKQQLNQPCSVQINFEVPTKDCSTEVTKSFLNHVLSSEDKMGMVDGLKSSETSIATPCMAIAVNTDPLSLLSLLRISTDTIRQLLSYMPTIDYHSYLSMLHFPYLIRNSGSHYVCNICGADFSKPSELTDHIQGHNLAKTKDCCVCRHVLDITRRARSLFSCQYCGQRFTRAYCCELHQQTCAKRLGLKHDVTSSLMILR